MDRGENQYFMLDDDIELIQWCDNNAAMIGSNLVSIQLLGTVKWKRKEP